MLLIFYIDRVVLYIQFDILLPHLTLYYEHLPMFSKTLCKHHLKMLVSSPSKRWTVITYMSLYFGTL